MAALAADRRRVAPPRVPREGPGRARHGLVAAVDERLARHDVARRKEGRVRHARVPVVRDSRALLHIAAAVGAAKVGERARVARGERVDAARVAAATQLHHVNVGRRLGGHALVSTVMAAPLAHVLDDEVALADRVEGAQPPAHSRRDAIDLESHGEAALRVAAARERRVAEVVALDAHAVGRPRVEAVAAAPLGWLPEQLCHR
mmetsp:Transcript_76650/g.230051  ORF Transcript_76650/g.230051 Transcript_76650/m.230051 type:complete len:204 (-) Transcript_76650:108-719(-)